MFLWGSRGRVSRSEVALEKTIGESRVTGTVRPFYGTTILMRVVSSTLSWSQTSLPVLPLKF